MAAVTAVALTAAAGAYGAHQQAKAAKKAAEADRLFPGTADDLSYIQDEARRLYDERENAKGPPKMKLKRLKKLAKDEFRAATGPGGGGGGVAGLGGGGGGENGGGGDGEGGRRGRGAAAGTGGPSGSDIISEINRRALEDDPTIAAARDYITKQLSGFDPSEYLDLYMTGGDLDLDSEVAKRIQEVYGGQFREGMEEQFGVIGDEFDTSGLFGSSAQALERASTRGEFDEAYNRAILEAQLGIRGQNIGLLESGMGFQQGLVGEVPELEQAEWIGLQTAGDIEMERQRIAADKQIAFHNDATQRAIANIQASVQRAGIAQAARDSALAHNRWEEAQAWEQELTIAQLEHGNAMSEWQYETGLPGAALDDYLQRTQAIAGMGPPQGTYAGPSPGSAALLGGIGGAVAGYGMAQDFGLGGGQQAAPLPPPKGKGSPGWYG